MLDNIFDQKVNIEMNVQIFLSHIEDADYVVLSSGLGGHAQFWQPQIQDLQTKFHVLTYDQEGIGNTLILVTQKIKNTSKSNENTLIVNGEVDQEI